MNASLIYTLEDWSGNIDPPIAPLGTFSIDTDDGNQIFPVDDTFSDTPGYSFRGLGFEAGVRVGATTYVFFAKPGDRNAIYTSAAWKDSQLNSDWFDQASPITNNTHTGPELFNN